MATAESTIGDASRFGGTGWLTVDSPVGRLVMNADTTRDAIRHFLHHCETSGGTVISRVVANRRGVVNRVEFAPSGSRTEGWYLYTRKPLSGPTPFEWRTTSVRRGRTASTKRPSIVAAGDGSGSAADPAMAAIVQFPHPGGEHVPSTDLMPWNVDRHRRKFLRSPGVVVDGDGQQVQQCEIAFWGEWEAPSRVVRRWPRGPGREPRVLQEPLWHEPKGSAFRQNTDPWVFGDSFRYSNCQQLTPRHAPSALQRLPVGSLVIFGSGVGGDFVVDTVFVVGEVVGRWQPFDFPYDVGAAFDTCTVQALRTCPPAVAGATFTLYRGACPAAPMNGMFSFVPCRRADADDVRFARPAVVLPGVINPASTQAASGAKRLRPTAEVKSAWSSIVEQVLQAGLVLGTAIATPSAS